MKLASAILSSRVRIPARCNRGSRGIEGTRRRRTMLMGSSTSVAWAAPIQAL
jgi:hypothetical protein